MKTKKGQLGIDSAPQVVLIVGVTFLLLATLAYIALKYQEGLPADATETIINESLTTVTYSGEYVAKVVQCNFENFAVVNIINGTGGATNETITATNYSYDSATGLVRSTTNSKYNNTDWKITYSYEYTGGTACNVTGSLQTEIANNTSIAGIVLTISLIGIVLAVLIGVFALARRRGL